MGAGEFETVVQRLIGQIGHWEATRWGAFAGSADSSRGDLVFALVQRLADHGADAEQRRRRPVPRLADLVLPDQLRVVADDLVAAGAPAEVLARAAGDVTEVRRHL